MEGNLHQQEEVTFPVLPTGYRFRPTDEELVVHYLTNKVNNKPLPAPVVQDMDAIQLHSMSPAELTKLVQGRWLPPREWFFFIFEDENYRKMQDVFEGNWNKLNDEFHHTFEGYWRKSTVEVHPIYDSDGNLFAFKEFFDYYIGKDHESAKKTHWKHEKYRLSSCKKDRWVLIRIRRGNHQTLESGRE